MTNLYHGSMYEHSELQPGYEHSGVLVRWDGTESNKNLYATTSRAEAISQAFASALEKKFKSVEYRTNKKTIDVVIPGKHKPTKHDFDKIGIFLYTIRYDEKDGWKKVNNAHNGLDNEWKTTKTVPETSIIRIEKIDLNDWLENKNLRIAHEEFQTRIIYEEFDSARWLASW